MVDFVEEGAGKVVGGFDADFGAVGEEGFDFDFFGASDESVDTWDGEAAFVIFDLFTFGFDDFGVDEGGK